MPIPGPSPPAFPGLSPVIVAVDPIPAALTHLRTMLDDPTITVAARVPNPRPALLVTLRRAGGVDRVHGILDRPRIDAQVWASTEFAAMALANQVRAYLLAAPGRVTGVSHAATFLGPTPIPDPDSGAARVLLTVEWQTRGTQEA